MVFLKSEIIFPWLDTKIPSISPSTSFLAGIQTRKSHQNKISLTLYSCFKISVCKKFKIWKEALWASLKSMANEEKI